MNKNIGTQESHIRSLAGALTILLALFVENYVLSIALAVLAAILAGTAFIRYCPINTLLKRDSREQETDTHSKPFESSLTPEIEFQQNESHENTPKEDEQEEELTKKEDL